MVLLKFKIFARFGFKTPVYPYMMYDEKRKASGQKVYDAQRWSLGLAEEDEGRVESRMAVVGRGFSATPERIAKLREQSEALDKQYRPKPSRRFSDVIDSKPAPEPSRKARFRDSRKQALPQRGPRPSLGQLGLKSKLSVEEEDPEQVVLKG